MDLGNFIKITNTPKSNSPQPPKEKPSASPTNKSSSLSNQQILGIGLLVAGFILIGIAIAIW